MGRQEVVRGESCLKGFGSKGSFEGRRTMRADESRPGNGIPDEGWKTVFFPI